MKSLKYKKMIIIMSSLLIFSCSSNQGAKINTNPSSMPSNTATPNKESKDFLKPRALFTPTTFNEPEAKALIMVADLPEYDVYRPAYTIDTRERHPDVDYYNRCIGPQAPHVATITNSEHIDGDSFRHIYDNSILVTATSSVESSKTPLEDVKYLKENKQHIKCLTDYFKIVRNLPLDYKVNITYKIVSDRDGILFAILDIPKIDTYPHQVVNIYTAYTKEHLIQYVLKLTSDSDKEIGTTGSEIKDKLYEVLKRKKELIS